MHKDYYEIVVDNVSDEDYEHSYIVFPCDDIGLATEDARRNIKRLNSKRQEVKNAKEKESIDALIDIEKCIWWAKVEHLFVR